MPGVLWANSPNRCADALYKPYQWAIAAQCGLSVADTVISNMPEAVREFVGVAPHATVAKSLGGAGISEGGHVHVAYTHRLSAEDLADLSGVQATATTVQRWVPKAHEVRLTVIGAVSFAVAIHAGSRAAYVDWRSDLDSLRYELVTAPSDVLSAAHEFMRRMRLSYAGFDFVITPDGRWVMLEANTGPQFGWLESATGAPMVSAMADLLAKGVS